MKFLKFRLFLFIAFISSGSFLSAAYNGFSNDTIAADTIKFIPPYAEDNERCFKCHGQSKYEYANETLGRQVKAMMFSERIVSREEFYDSNHKNFSCTDCHSAEYATFPHSGTLRMEPKLNCIDCHGGDEKLCTVPFRGDCL